MNIDNLRPIFIIGNPRSGTTLLRLILHSHSNIAIPPEAGFAMWLYKQYEKYGPSQLNNYLHDMKKTKKIDNWKIDWTKLEKHIKTINPYTYPQLINSIYTYYCNSINNVGVRWGDKNNFYLEYIDKIKTLFPKAFFIHIVRDGRNVACSYKELSTKTFTSRDAPKLPDDILKIANKWNNNINRINFSFEKFNYQNVIEIRLEDLVSEPRKSLTKIMNFIGEDFEVKMFEYYKISEAKGSEPSQYLEWKKKNTKPIQDEPSDKFKLKLTKEEIKTFNTIAGKNLLRYNYQL